ncbi:MFS transporter [Robiginitalea sediminis]|uniref:MFS transporter n=1 Tax=Robiginitalea sediminis TaxID=1982593 RepID=UPI00117AE2D8|nr:MFS transporter [Robiginitalea sediminis]
MPSSRSHLKAIIALAMGAFGIALTEFVIMGILPKVAGSLSVTIPQAGHFISAYALGVVVGAPLLTRLASRWPSRKVLLGLMLWFTLFNGLSALAEGYYSMLAIRFLAGLPHGAYFGIGAVRAARLAPPGREARAIARMFSGFTLANVLGVPLGTYIGNTWHWGASFLMIAVVGILTVLCLFLWMPPESGKDSGESSKGSGMGGWELWSLLALTAIGTGGFFAWYSYIAPLLMEVSGHTETTVSLAMVLSGVGMVIGNLIGARLVEWLRPVRATAVGMSSMALMLVLNAALAPYPGWVLVMCFVIGMVTFTMAAPIQMSIIDASKGSEMLASSFNQSAFNIANASGAFFAGLPLTMGYGYTSPSLVGAVLAAVGAIIALGIWQRKRHLKTP